MELDLRSGPLVNGAIGAGLGARGFGLPATAVFVLAAEVAYAAMVHVKPHWVGTPDDYSATTFALDIGAALLGWGVVSACKSAVEAPAAKAISTRRYR